MVKNSAFERGHIHLEPGTGEDEAGGSKVSGQKVKGQPGLCSEVLTLKHKCPVGLTTVY